MQIKCFYAFCVCSCLCLFLSGALCPGAEMLCECDFGKTEWAPADAKDMAKWRAAGWRIEGDKLPKGWTPEGAGGIVRMVTEHDIPKAMHLQGHLAGPGVALPDGNWIIVQADLRGGSLAVAGVTYGGPQGGFLGTFDLLRADGGPGWNTAGAVYHFKNPAIRSVCLRLLAEKETDVTVLRVLPAAGAMEAYRKAYPLIRRPWANLAQNGGFEETKHLLPEELQNWRTKKWDLGPNSNPALAVGFGPHPAYEGQRLVIVDDPAQARSGRRFVEFTLMGGGGFHAKPDKQYAISLWACGRGKLSIFANCYGGPQGGFVGNLPITAGEGWTLTPEWQKFQQTVPLQIKGYQVLGINPVFNAIGLARVDDWTVAEIDTPQSLLVQVRKARGQLQETLTDQVQIGPRQREMLDFLLAEADDLEEHLADDKPRADSMEIADRVAALVYAAAGVKSEVEFGEMLE